MPAFLYAGFLTLLFFSSFFLVLSAFPSTLTLHRSLPLNHITQLSQLTTRDRFRHARFLQTSSAVGVVDFPVDGSSDPFTVGLYFTRVKIGTPPREFYVQIDTGSDILWVTCAACQGCPQSSGLGIQLEFYNSGSSSSSRQVDCSNSICNYALQTTEADCSSENQCSYTFQYGDGSGTAGYYVQDNLSFDTVIGDSSTANSSAPIVFGCSNYQSGDLTKTDRAVDGIFGFGQHELSVISQLSSQGITPRVFSHCLKGSDNGGGILVLGEVLEPGIVYSPLVPSQPHYNLNLQSIALNGQSLPIDPAVFETSRSRGTIVDSGTTLAYLVEEAYDPFISALTSTVSQSARYFVSKGNECFLVTGRVGDIFPLVTFNFAGGASIVLNPGEYLINQGYIDGAAMWCLGFQRSPQITILGDLVLKDKIVVYDLARQRIGWTSYDCSKSVNVSLASGKNEFSIQLSVSSSTQAELYKLIRIASAVFLVQFFLVSGLTTSL